LTAWSSVLTTLTATAVVVQFIDDHRDRFGVEPICRVLTTHAVPIAPSGYYAFKKRAPSARAIADAELIVQIERVFWDRKLGREISGARKIWRLLRREGIIVARCTVAMPSPRASSGSTRPSA